MTRARLSLPRSRASRALILMRQPAGEDGLSATHRHTLICTAGTSLFANLGRPATDDDAVRAALVKARDRAGWDEAAALLHRILKPTDRLCGAEINSVSDLLANGMVEKGRLHLLVSDTPDGQKIGAVLGRVLSVRRLAHRCP